MPERSEERLGTAPLGKLIFSLALPAVLAQLVNLLYSIVDRVYIGHIPEVGALALTGMGLCTPLILIVAAFGAFVGMGGAPPVPAKDAKAATIRMSGVHRPSPVSASAPTSGMWPI